MNNEVKSELNNEQLEKVSGGGWGHNIIYNERKYNDAGVKTKWTNNPFVTDKFYWNNEQISDDEAAAIVFYTYMHEKKPKSVTEAFDFKTDNVEAYKEYIKNVNV